MAEKRPKRKKMTKAEIKASAEARKAKRKAELEAKFSSGVDLVAQGREASRIAHAKAEAKKQGRRYEEPSAPAPREDLGFTFSREAGLKITDAAKASPQIADISSMKKYADAGTKASLVQLGDRYFVVEGKKPAGVENKIDAGEAFAATQVKAEAASKIMAKFSAAVQNTSPSETSAPANDSEAPAPSAE